MAEEGKLSVPMLRESKASPATPLGVELWFEKLLNEIRVLAAEIDRESGILFLKTHTLSEQQIAAHPSLERIRAMCAQIDDLYERWRTNKTVTADEYKLYTQRRIEVEQELGKLRVRIIERRPTFLDLILRAFDALVEFLRRHMEQLGDNILNRIGYMEPPT
jgi:hypothetical protein